MLPTKRRRTPSSVFLPGDVFVVFPARIGRAKETRRIDLRQPRSYYFFHAPSKGGSRVGYNGAKKRRGVRVDDSPPPFFVFTSISDPPLLLFSFSLYSPSSSLRDLIRCRKSGDAIPRRRTVYTVGQARLPNYLLTVQWRNASRQHRVSSSFFLSSFSINFILAFSGDAEFGKKFFGKKFFARMWCWNTLYVIGLEQNF